MTTKTVYCVFESVDSLYVNFFTKKKACETWISDSEKMGDKILGPFEVEVDNQEEVCIVLGCDRFEQIEQVYTQENIPSNAEEQHNSLYGPYQLFEDIAEFEAAVDES